MRPRVDNEGEDYLYPAEYFISSSCLTRKREPLADAA